MTPIDRELWKPQTVFWCAPREWSGPEKDYKKLGKPGSVPEELIHIVEEAMEEIAEIVQRRVVQLEYESRKTTWNTCHFHIYGVDELPSALNSSNGHCYHYRKTRREMILLRREVADREREFQEFLVRHELYHGWGLEHATKDSIMVPADGAPYVTRPTASDIAALREVQS
jgi:hypothetical protein